MERAVIGDRANAARWMNLALGCWLFVSAFLWPHQRHVQTNTWFVGMLMACTATLAMAVPGARRITSVLAAWLFFSTILMPHTDMATLLNNGLVAVAAMAFSLLPPFTLGMERQSHPYEGNWSI